MKAPGSVGSSANAVDRQDRYLKSNQHRKDRAQAERIYDRASNAEQGVKEHLRKKLSDPVYVKETAQKIARQRKEAAKAA